MNDSLTVFLPVRKGSKRVKNKNTRSFSKFKDGLLELKLEQLVTIEGINEIIVSSNDEKCLEIIRRYQKSHHQIRLDERPDYLGNDNTDLVELINYAGELAVSDHILWTHVTSPFVDPNMYQDMMDRYFSVIGKGFDSLMSVKIIQNFIWDKERNDIINRKGVVRWPRTQDLKPLYEINSAAFVASKKIYKENKDRVGQDPFLFELDDIASMDIDWESDFKLAEVLYEELD